MRFTKHFLGRMHCASTGCGEGNLIACLDYTMNCCGQPGRISTFSFPGKAETNPPTLEIMAWLA